MKNVPSVIDGIKFVVKDEIRVTTKEIAKEFEKEHKNVMRAVRSLNCSSEFSRLNFEPVNIIEKNGIGADIDKSFFNVTRDGWMFLVMGFTGKKAAHKKVLFIEAFNKMESFIKEEFSRREEDDRARFGCKPMTDALKNTRLEIGKGTKPYHYSNEHNLIYRIVLGVTRKKWCEAHDIDMKERFRDHMPEPMITAIADMQQVNTAFIDMGWDYQKRKEELNKLYTKRHLDRCLDAIVKLEE